jgi:uncharacterized protein (UPF0335 family)
MSKKETKKELEEKLEKLEQENRGLRWEKEMVSRAAEGFGYDVKEGEFGWSKEYADVVRTQKELQSEKMSGYYTRYDLYSRFYMDVTDFLRKYQVKVHEGNIAWALQELVAKVSFDPQFYDPYMINKTNEYWVVGKKEKNTCKPWEFKGAAHTRENALKLCKDETYFIWSFNLWRGFDVESSIMDKVEWPLRKTN